MVPGVTRGDNFDDTPTAFVALLANRKTRPTHGDHVQELAKTAAAVLVPVGSEMDKTTLEKLEKIPLRKRARVLRDTVPEKFRPKLEKDDVPIYISGGKDASATRSLSKDYCYVMFKFDEDKQDGRWVLVDESSSGGVSVDGVRVAVGTPKALKDGDTIVFGAVDPATHPSERRRERAVEDRLWTVFSRTARYRFRIM